MNLHHLELFLAVVVDGNVSRAALRMGVSQPAVSRQIHELEESLGLPLLERLPRGIRPTEAGVALATHAKAIFSMRERAARDMEERRDGLAGRLSIAASRTIGSALLPDLLARFRTEQPGPTLHVEITNTRGVEARLREGTVELGLVEGSVSEEFESESFARDELVAVAAPTLLGSKKAPRDLRGFCQLPLALREAGSGTRSLVDQRMEQAGAKIEPAFVLDGSNAIRAFVEAGLAASFLPRIVVASSLERGTMVEIPLKDTLLEREFRWIKRRGQPLGPATSAFLAILERLRRDLGRKRAK
ncbi:MAG TPA: LysR family transcriptional regulator [Fibrobacteria bacterium]|nr:LysR family transcriptional regulator [Fibrobacteria bacterium]HOX51021.1 LysR family transcriptional regulator [Fibrobacteria bacterium]